jgi:hypothetical protein
MMTRILAHQRDLGNGVGLHYSGFRRFSAFPASQNQLLAPTQPRENRRHHPPIREVGLARANPSRTAASKPSDEAAVIFVTLATAINSSLKIGQPENFPLPTRRC